MSLEYLNYMRGPLQTKEKLLEEKLFQVIFDLIYFRSISGKFYLRIVAICGYELFNYSVRTTISNSLVLL